ncbi:hypothetical protein WDJ51_00070 [Rathayibacter sp. YIM 133350]|uniref:hypothetical protein n=1 Tax=Rathayibacter sp. YIM 133350 TaxID=3131992 RepID=UPI00307CE086
MARDKDVQGNGNAYTRFFDRLDDTLSRGFVSPPPASDDDASQQPTDKACPLCGHPMSEHIVDHSTPNTVVDCPTEDRLPLRADNGPLGELGMPASEERLAKISKRR